MTDKTEVPDKPETSDKSKLDKLLEGGNITLNCLIPGEEARDIFEVTISNANNNRVSSLGAEIRNRRLDLFQDIDSSRLVLIFPSITNKKSLSRDLRHTHFDWFITPATLIIYLFIILRCHGGPPSEMLPQTIQTEVAISYQCLVSSNKF
jgi:Crinkler effector protein N-terminal domain